MNHSRGLSFYGSNHMEYLADAAAEILGAPLSSPFAAETVVVPNRDMERWLSLQLAERLGIWANADYFLPNAFAEALFRRAFPDLPQSSAFAPEMLVWKVMSLLSSPLLDDRRFSQLASYLREPRPLKLFQLSARIADVFDQYTLFRPELVRAWEQATRGDDHWQAVLWRAIVSGTDEPDRALLRERYLSLVNNRSAVSLPERVIVFGFSSLPPYHVGMLASIAALVPVHLFVFNPCIEYWDLIVSGPEALKIQKRELKKSVRSATPAEKKLALHLEQGNSLLAALGAYGRDFLAELHNVNFEETMLPFDPGMGSVLATIQSDILLLRDRGVSDDAPRLAIRAADRSVQVHSCHSPLREIEVLYDHLLDLFNTQPDLNPSDILVMAPDIEPYAPFVRAVFDAPEERSMTLPYSIADCFFGNERSVAQGLLVLLRLPRSRFGASEVMSLFELPELRAAYSIDESDLPLLYAWIRDSGIRWGLNESTQSRLGLPASPENTWEAGCTRLLLGYALPSVNGQTFGGYAGCEAVEGMQSALAGRLVEFTSALESFEKSCNSQHTLSEWSALLCDAIDTFFEATEGGADDIPEIRALCYSLRVPEEQGFFSGAVDLETIINLLTLRLEKSTARPPFTKGGIVFCSMLPMRSIPHKVICCIGMNDTAFPRKRFHASWDLVAAHPRRGDRSLDQEDRYFFLEAVMSARNLLYISYVGQDVYDNALSRPSVVVEELLSYIDKGFFTEDGTPQSPPEAVRKLVEIRHSLQPWNPDYFVGDSRRFSYSSIKAVAAANVLTHEKDRFVDTLFSEELTQPCPELLRPSIEAFVGFFRNPARYFLDKRLGITLEDRDDRFEDTELFLMSNLDKYNIGRELSEHILKGKNSGERYSLLKASGALPHGNVGKYQFDVLAGAVGAFVAAVRPMAEKEPMLPPFSFEQTIGQVSLAGEVDNCFSSYRLMYRFANASPKVYLDLWINHLLLNAFAPASYPRTSLFVGKDGAIHLAPVANALEELRKIAGWFEKGLRSPLQFFPRSSYCFTEKVVLKHLPAEAAIEAATEIWEGNDYAAGEKDDPWVAYCFRSGIEFGEAFAATALDIWETFIRNLQQAEVA